MKKKIVLNKFLLILCSTLSLVGCSNTKENKVENEACKALENCDNKEVIHVKVDGVSMMPTLKPEQSGIAYTSGEVERGDIIVFTLNDTTYIKRVIGLPNETVKIDNEVYVNNEQLDENSYLSENYISNNGYSQEVTLADDEYYVLGDSRLSSVDSRSFGAIKKENIIGYKFQLNE